MQKGHLENQSLPSPTPDILNKYQNTIPQNESSSTESTLSDLSELSDPPSDIEQPYPQDGEVASVTSSDSQDSESLTSVHAGRLSGRKDSETIRNELGISSRPGISKDTRPTARTQKSHNEITAGRKRSRVEDEVFSSYGGKFSTALEAMMDN